MKPWRKTILSEGLTADPLRLNTEAARMAEVWNGNLDCLDLGPSVGTSAKLVANVCNDYSDTANPIPTSTAYLRSQISVRSWTTVYTTTVTVNDEGVIIGGFNFSIRSWPNNVNDLVYYFSVAVFIDGVEAGRTDLVMNQIWAADIPFTMPVEKGTKTLTIGVKALNASQTIATNPDEVLRIQSTQLWTRVAKR